MPALTPPLTIAITGGIGSGKSVVSRIVTALGYPVYDCDSRAKSLMDNSDEIKRRLASEISADVIVGDNIHRQRLASIVFGDPQALLRLNTIVHSAVREDFLRFRSQHHAAVFFETAILSESGFTSLADEVWLVTAPVELRITRVMERNNYTREQVEARIAVQPDRYDCFHNVPCHTIVNDGVMPVLQQVTNLLQIS